jgi:hypothetical protein
MAIRVMPPAWAAPRPAGFTPRAAIGDRGRCAKYETRDPTLTSIHGHWDGTRWGVCSWPIL